MTEYLFRRYRNGRRMAEDVRITGAPAFEDACVTASRIAAQYKDGTTLVYEPEAELAAEREAHAETRAMLPNKTDTGVPPRPTEMGDWWQVAIKIRRELIKAKKDNTILFEMHQTNEGRYAATRRERDAALTRLAQMEDALAKARGALSYLSAWDADQSLAKENALAAIDAVTVGEKP
jgi:hypothetical protein